MIVWKRAPEMTGPPLLQALSAQLHGRVLAAYIFGSHARGIATSESDIDLVLIAQTDAPFVERGRAYADLFTRFGAVDLVVYTPGEWAKKEADLRAFGPLVQVPFTPSL